MVKIAVFLWKMQFLSENREKYLFHWASRKFIFFKFEIIVINLIYYSLCYLKKGREIFFHRQENYYTRKINDGEKRRERVFFRRYLIIGGKMEPITKTFAQIKDINTFLITIQLMLIKYWLQHVATLSTITFWPLKPLELEKGMFKMLSIIRFFSAY